MKVLVLGSEGTIGKAVSTFFIKKGHDVIRWDIKLDRSHDLRKPGCLDTILGTVDFIVFLAFDVGGAKYDVNSYDYIDGNLSLLQNTFTYIKKYNIPFIHTSSTMSNMNHNPYAVLKRVGELYTTLLGGINVKLWNVYGSEEVCEKSHVIPDFIHQALHSNAITIRGDGSEERMFLHSDDFSRALYAVFEHFKDLDKGQIIDITSGSWVSIMDIACIIKEIMKEDYNRLIDIRVTCGSMDSHNKRNEPDTSSITKIWTQAITLKDGIRRCFPSKGTNTDGYVNEY